MGYAICYLISLAILSGAGLSCNRILGTCGQRRLVWRLDRLVGTIHFLLALLYDIYVIVNLFVDLVRHLAFKCIKFWLLGLFVYWMVIILVDLFFLCLYLLLNIYQDFDWRRQHGLRGVR